METGTFPAFDHRIERPDGMVLPVQCRGEVSEPEDGTMRIHGTVLDVTDREADR